MLRQTRRLSRLLSSSVGKSTVLTLAEQNTPALTVTQGLSHAAFSTTSVSYAGLAVLDLFALQAPFSLCKPTVLSALFEASASLVCSFCNWDSTKDLSSLLQAGTAPLKRPTPPPGDHRQTTASALFQSGQPSSWNALADTTGL